MKVTKKYKKFKELVDTTKVYTADEAVVLLDKAVKDGSYKRKFVESIDAAFKLNLKAKHTIRDTISLPTPPTTKDVRILVFAKADKADEAKKAGADFIGDDDLIEKIKGGWYDFDVAIATPDMMKDVGKLGANLGRRGLMPNPKTGTVTLNVAQAVSDFKKGKSEFRADKAGVINLKIGHTGMSSENVRQNLKALYQEILIKKPSDLKGEYIKSVAVSATMSPSIKITHQSI